MASPKGGYYNKAGKRIPGVTTITGSFKESGGLIHWSWNTAFKPLMEARALLQQVAEANGDSFDLLPVLTFLERPVESFDYKHTRKQAADAGTCAHEMFRCYTHGIPFDHSLFPDRAIQIAEPAFAASREWARQTSFEVMEAEVSLVSEKHQYGGTRDGVLVDGKRGLADVKTSNDIYPEMIAQLGAYAILDREHGAEIDGGFHILKFSKQEEPTDPVSFTHKYWSHIDAGERAFLRMRALYDDVAELRRLCK